MKKNKNWLIGTLLFLMIVLLLGMFVRQYMVLGDTIEEERATYVSEIKNQLVKNIKSEKDQQVELVDVYIQVLTDANPQNFEKIKELLSTRQGEVEGD